MVRGVLHGPHAAHTRATTHGGCTFSSHLLTRTVASSIGSIPHALFSLFFPADCRICNTSLTGWTRIPVCDDCLKAPEPLDAEFFCSACRTPFRNALPLDDHGVCRACRAGLRGFDRAATYGFYEGKLRSLIHLLKYAGIQPLAAPLAGLMHRALPVDQTFDAIVPVPLHWRKSLDRGFNQAELLARELARKRNIPMAKALRRKRSGAVQASLSLAERRRNVAGVFEVRAKQDVRDKRILLIDDVMTTGATASACASVLKRAGAKSVSLLTVARVDRRH